MLSWPGETVRIVTDFSHPFLGDQVYMVHCHKLEHEDGGMMLDLKKVTAQPGAEGQWGRCKSCSGNDVSGNVTLSPLLALSLNAISPEARATREPAR